jgi:hypothetical protein
MKRIFFFLAAILAALCVLLALYYSIPGIPHPFFVAGYGIVNPASHPGAAMWTHHKYSAAFLGLAVLFGLAAFLSRRKRGGIKTA